MSGILDLPAELVTAIFSFLEDQDILAARLSSRYLESSSLSTFGQRFFRKKGYLITTSSINVLKSIADHKELRKHCQHVWFNPDCYTYVEPDWFLEDEATDTFIMSVDSLCPENKQRWDAYQECMIDHSNLLYGSKLEQDLTAALINLPNLETIGMRRSEDHQPWGWRTLKEQIGEDPRKIGRMPHGPTYLLSGPTYLFMAMVNSVAATRSNIKRLYTDAVEIDNIHPTLLSSEKLNTACRSLLYLEINVSKAPVNHKPNSNYITLNKDGTGYGDGLLRLLKARPNLLELGLQIFPDMKTRYRPDYRNVEGWETMYQCLIFKRIVENVQLSHLTRLKLEKLVTRPELLVSFLAPSQASLQSLKIRDIRLLGNRAAGQPPRQWQSVFTFLRDSCPSLAYFLAYNLKYDEGSIAFSDRQLPSAHYQGPAARAVPDAYTEQRGGPLFADYSDVSLDVSGREAVEAKLAEIVVRHWYRKPLVSYTMDEEVWHTDTSDEEW